MIQKLLAAQKENQLYFKLKIGGHGPSAAADEVF
jgi:hypothetical protein